MTPQEAQIVRDVFAKIRMMGTATDDAEAARVVEAELRANPAAALNLVRVVVGLERERDQIAAEAEALAAENEQLKARATPSPSGGGLFGGASPWGSGRGAAQPQPPQTQQPGPWGAPQPSGPWGAPAQPQGGSFLGGMLRTGAGVAGGLFAFEALKGLFGGGHGDGSGHETAAGLLDEGARGRENPPLQEADHGRDRGEAGGFGGETAEPREIVADDIDFFGGGDDFDV